jgi:hypothetical protein
MSYNSEQAEGLLQGVSIVKAQWLQYVPCVLTFKNLAFCPSGIFMYFV